MPDQIAQFTALDDSQDAQLVSALARGVRILQCFSVAEKELGIKELLEKTGLPKPTLFRLVNTLCELGLLRYSERVSKYVPGIDLLSLAAPALSRMTIRQIARPQMQELAEYCKGQVCLAVGYRLNMVYAEVQEGAKNAVYRPEAGTRLSLSRTATGRAYLMTLPQAERERYLREVRDGDSARADWLASRLEETAHDLAERGFCSSGGDLRRDIESVAVPVSAPIDDETWVFSCTVPSFNLAADQLVDDIAPRLMALVRGVEAALGNVRGVAHFGARV